MQNLALPPLISTGRFTVHGHGADLWYAWRSPDKRFIRMGRQEYLVASALDGQRTAAQVASQVAEIEPELMCTEVEVLQISGWLANMGLLVNPSGAAPISASKPPFSLNPIYCKLPLISGHRLESWVAPVVPLLSWPLAVVVGGVWVIGGACVLMNWDQLARTTSELFVADRWLWWGLAWLLLKAVHELGHAIMAARVGSQIRSAGISLIFMAPVPYVDLSDLWAIPNRWQRGLTCASGMMVEMTLAAVAALIAVTTDNQSLQYFCCAVATMGTVTTIAFNASPLMRFDGYFILTDLINYPNLYTDAQVAAKRFAIKCLLPWRPSPAPHRVGLVLYGLACYQYRLVMMLSLAMGTILAFEGIGVVLVVWGAYAMFVAPWLTARRNRKARQPSAASVTSSSASTIPAGSKGLETHWYRRYRESLLMAGLVAVLAWLVITLPSPFQPVAPGTIALRQPHMIRAETEGFLVEVLVGQGTYVTTGQLIARLSNPDLVHELALKSNELAQLDERIMHKRAQGHLAEYQATQSQRDSLALHVQQLKQQVDNLQVRTTRDGQLVGHELFDELGLFVRAGQPLACVAQLNELEVIASVNQSEVARWRTALGNPLATHISGGPRMSCVLESVEPRAHNCLTEPLFAACYGGPIAVEPQPSHTGEDELRLIQPRFEAKLRFGSPAMACVSPGQIVWVRTPGEPTSLWKTVVGWCQNQWQQLLRHNQPIG